MDLENNFESTSTQDFKKFVGTSETHTTPKTNISSELIEECRDILFTHAKSFSIASLFLPKPKAQQAAIVYAFCRIVDDCVDEARTFDEARAALAKIKEELCLNQRPRPIIHAFLDFLSTYQIPLELPLELIRGVESDIGSVRMRNEAEFYRYCFRVAGSVGLLMRPLLGAHATRSVPYAVDLGIAMQITNICRDVKEDFYKNRIYIPLSILRANNLREDRILAQPQRPLLFGVIIYLLNQADKYYEQARYGMIYIPWKARFSILIASTLYQGIGHKIKRLGPPALDGRVRLSNLEKIYLISKALLIFSGTLILPWLFKRRLVSHLDRGYDLKTLNALGHKKQI